ncbi:MULTISPECIES: MarR family winged helix-turn-helix transcriptional regulator [Roseobacteraceae]|jgi:DNA-binding MarR family transcriptional regulator|uniref:Transcriptional regulator SlyA n=1 Tax=Pseudosulfitobacter pseudonitzschiae TaxID=1402135 RepID=A0A221JWW5_9RHOB|nr:MULTISPECIES: MarR family winged helix-turn-helix transcriptional regulator [Roseobacteraceae]ASM71120.1 transcriptional regulator SlyA [Pseudosulfitobacter pseudonitzschiae]
MPAALSTHTPDPKVIAPDSLGFLISDLARLMRGTFEREIEKADVPITTSEARVLVYMARCGATRQNVLAELLGLAPMSVTGFLDNLEKAGLVKRAADPADRRAKIVTLTDAAQGLLDRIAIAGQRARTLALAGLTEDQVAAFKSAALGIRANLETARATSRTEAGS